MYPGLDIVGFVENEQELDLTRAYADLNEDYIVNVVTSSGDQLLRIYKPFD